MPPNNTILVVGAGELGMSILNALTSHPAHKDWSTTVLLRPSTISSPEKRQHVDNIKSLDVSILPGDTATASENELASLFSPFHTVIIAMGIGSAAGNIKIVKAALNAKVPRLFPWQFGFNYDKIGRGSPQPLWDAQMDIRDMIRGQQNVTTNWVIVSVGLFASVLFEPAFGIIDLGQKIVRGFGSWNREITVTTTKDVGRITAEVLFSENPTFKNEIVYAPGDTLSWQEIADTVQDLVVGKKFERTLVQKEDVDRILESNPEDQVAPWQGAFAVCDGLSWNKQTTYNHEHAIALMNVAEYARTHVW